VNIRARGAVIVDGVRTPVGRRGGVLSKWHPVDLLAEMLRNLMQRNGIDPALIDDVIAGCVLQQEQQAGTHPCSGWSTSHVVRVVWQHHLDERQLS
jgi:acetyl-CoA acetyltransferase